MTAALNPFEQLWQKFTVEEKLATAKLLEIEGFRRLLETRFAAIEAEQLNLEFGTQLALEYIVLHERKTVLKELISLLSYIAQDIDAIVRAGNAQS